MIFANGFSVRAVQQQQEKENNFKNMNLLYQHRLAKSNWL